MPGSGLPRRSVTTPKRVGAGAVAAGVADGAGEHEDRRGMGVALGSGVRQFADEGVPSIGRNSAVRRSADVKRRTWAASTPAVQVGSGGASTGGWSVTGAGTIRIGRTSAAGASVAARDRVAGSPPARLALVTGVRAGDLGSVASAGARSRPASGRAGRGRRESRRYRRSSRTATKSCDVKIATHVDSEHRMARRMRSRADANKRRPL